MTVIVIDKYSYVIVIAVSIKRFLKRSLADVGMAQ